MFAKLLKLPVRAAKVALRFVRGSKDQGDGPTHYTPASGGLKRPAEAVKAAPTPPPVDDHDHGHDHSHSHSHSHDHAVPAEEPAPAPAKPQVDVYAEQTPNPNAQKFTVMGRKVVDKGSLSFNSRDEAEGSALGEALFKVVGVRSVFAVNDFVTITKEDGADWAYLEPAIINAIQAVF